MSTPAPSPPPTPPPPPGPSTPPPPAGPKRTQIVPLDPDSPAGRAATDALSEVLADILLAIRRRQTAGRAA